MPPPLAVLRQAYEALDRPHRDVVELLSATYLAVAQGTLLELLNAVGSRPLLGESWVHPKLTAVVTRLQSAGLVVREDKRVACAPLFREVALRLAAREGRLRVLVPPLRKALARFLPWHMQYRHSYESALQAFRLELYLGHPHTAAEQLGEIARQGYSATGALAEVLGNPFDPETLGWVPEELTARFLAAGIVEPHDTLEHPNPELLAYAQDLAARRGVDVPPAIRGALAERALLRGEWAEAEALVAGREAPERAAILGALAFLRGDHAAALDHYQPGLKLLRAATGKRKVFFAELPGLFFIFALLGTQDPTRRKEAQGHVRTALGVSAQGLRHTYQALDSLLAVLSGEVPLETTSSLASMGDEELSLGERLVAARAAKHGAGPAAVPQPAEPATLDLLGQTLCRYWMGHRQPVGRAEALAALCRRAEAGGYRLAEALTAEVLGALGQSGYAQRAERLRNELGVVPLTEITTREEPWERTLAAALDLFEPGSGRPGAGESADARLVWLLSWHGETPTLRPVEQRRTAKGAWSVGKNVALKRLKEQPESLPFLTPQDLAACAAIQLYESYWDRPSLVLHPDLALRALVGHPLVLLEGAPETRVEVLRGEPELRVERTGQRLTLQVVPELTDASECQLLRESPTRVRVIEFGPRARKLASLFGAKGLKVPVKAEERVRRVLAAVAAELTVHSDDEGALGALEELPADPRPRVHLLPAGSGLRAELLAQPLGSDGPYCPPGEGGRSLIAEVAGRRVATRRDLAAERRAAEAVVAACPALGPARSDGLEWVVEDPEECLELLLQLQAVGDAAVVEWPRGETLKAPRRVALDALRIEFKRDRDWFAAGGELRVDDGLTLGLRELLDLAAAAPGRFVPLGDDQYLALTHAFRKRLDELRAFTEAHGKGLRFHPLAAPALEECAAEAGHFRGDKAWKDLLRRFAEAQELTPPVPTTLAAELRPYQVDGYRWLMRLAHWGVGACLADDMGLGKTLQALALLLTRAKGGPCLVVAPTSVCANWAAEARRFAPSLNPVVFGPGDREKTLAALGPFDLVLASYGLLLQEGERLAGVAWEVVVLDEAQAIKNVAAKRSQAAMELKAGFKIITTGTPVENHLGELWNLFRFVNPGLLGSREGFQKRFASPIENGDRNAQARLKRLISPFLLRRTKSQVLDDLPPRTEILHRVELGPEEAALYEALRGRALERLAAYEGPPLAKRFQVLAELMRLRRACCHPRLVLPEAPLPSAKLEAFGELLDELLANRHKALVFSQFVDHLSIVREYVERRGVAYQYLDGSTPARDRQRRVDAFQAGEGELFLISLKAGGLGLNLTAADYVVHLDPWWNPAVEDQASDRAHRIGQTRPVTIYRLVARGTVEDKIVELHHKKRELADSLLEDADGGGRLSAEDLLAILREE